MIKYTFIAPFLAALLLSGCSSDESTIPGSGRLPVDATVPLVVESGTLDTETVTRAVTALPDGQSIGVFLAGTDYMAVNNRQYTRTSGKWGPQGGVVNTIYLGGATAQVSAYHPWTTGLNNSGAIPLTSQVFAADKDLSFDVNHDVDGSSANKSVTFAMTRAYARLGFKLQRSNYMGKGELQKLEIKNLLAGATLNITDGVYSTKDGTTAVSVTQSKNVVVPTDESTTIDWGEYLMIPCTPTGEGMVLTVTIDGKTMTTTVPKATYTPVKGEYKIITITVHGTAINATTVTTEDWPAAGSIGPVVPQP